MASNPDDFRAEIASGEPGGRSTIVRLVGEIDLANLPDLRAALGLAAERSRSIVVDLAGVSFMGAAGASALFKEAERVRDQGGELVVANPPPIVRKVIDIVSAGAPLVIAGELVDDKEEA
jgi:anti-sigma B factor antagonist